MRQFIKTFFLGITEAFIPRSARGGAKQIVPQSSVSGRALTAVISIMSFLACLTTGVVYMVNQSADAWFNDIASEVTVQVSPRDGVDIEGRIKKVVALLDRQVGIAHVRPFSLHESSALLEPWLGASDTLSALPVPRLIAVRIDRNRPPDLGAIKRKLDARFKGVLLDDHRHWQAQLRSLTRSVGLGGIGILILVAIATIAVVVSAARSAMASNHEIVEVLHFVGAQRKFIASEFERHFLALGIRSGLFGALLATIVFLLAPFAIEVLGGGSVTAAEIRQLVGSAQLDLTGYSLLGLIVIAVAAICMFTSSYWVDRILNTEGSVANPHHSPDSRFGVSSKTQWGDSGGDSEQTHPDKRRKSGILTRGVGLVVRSALVLAFIFVGGFLVFASSIDSAQKAPRQQADGIVVLTGGKSRINEAVRLLSDGKAKRLLISGVHVRTSKRQLARHLPSAKPLFDCCIDLGRTAQDTIGNAREAEAWARRRRFKSLIVVTSGYHMPRALAEFNNRMPDIKLVSFSVKSPSVKTESWWTDGATASLLFSEYLKFIPSAARLGVARVGNLLEGANKKG